MNNTEVILSKVLAESHYVHIQNKEKKEENSSGEGSKKIKNKILLLSINE